ncbi:diaminopimelate epimerase [Chloroflexota bacterium]
MDFTKIQGAGNDFVVIEASRINNNWPEMAAVMCDRHFGIGADGLLVVMPSASADFEMHIFNHDGSEAEACGNGLRCLVRYVVETGLIDSDAEELEIETIAGIRKAWVTHETGKLPRIQVNMGAPEFAAEDIPVLLESPEGDTVDIKSLLSNNLVIDGKILLLYFVSMGNPHAVYFGDRPVADFPLPQLGPKIETHNIFPNRINFEVAQIINRHQISARVWERGVGETLACGSGACAISVAARLLGHTDSTVEIQLPGGTLEICWQQGNEVRLSGPTEIVYSGKWIR